MSELELLFKYLEAMGSLEVRPWGVTAVFFQMEGWEARMS